MNTAELVGECGFVEVDYPELYLPDRLWMTRFTGDSSIHAKWLAYLWSSESYRTRIGSIATGTSGSMKNLAKAEFLAMPIPVPPLVEQHAIAAALGDVDALIASLERLIAKKRDIKQATMQQLLTGRTRLPGFSGEWIVSRLGKLGTAYGGLVGKTKTDFGKGTSRYISFLNVMNNVVIDTDELELVEVGPSENQAVAYPGDLLFNGSSETPDEVGMCSVLLDEVAGIFLNSFCFGVRLNSDADAHGLYLAYFFRSDEGRKLLRSLAQGATRYNLSKTVFLKQEFRLPGLGEQKAIAAVLSDMDAEIEALERRLAKTRALKQGMMQELLTGRIRLVEAPAASQA